MSRRSRESGRKRSSKGIMGRRMSRTSAQERERDREIKRKKEREKD